MWGGFVLLTKGASFQQWFFQKCVFKTIMLNFNIYTFTVSLYIFQFLILSQDGEILPTMFGMVATDRGPNWTSS
jgi:hypothetical protein